MSGHSSSSEWVRHYRLAIHDLNDDVVVLYRGKEPITRADFEAAEASIDAKCEELRNDMCMGMGPDEQRDGDMEMMVEEMDSFEDWWAEEQEKCTPTTSTTITSTNKPGPAANTDDKLPINGANSDNGSGPDSDIDTDSDTTTTASNASIQGSQPDNSVWDDEDLRFERFFQSIKALRSDLKTACTNFSDLDNPRLKTETICKVQKDLIDRANALMWQIGEDHSRSVISTRLGNVMMEWVADFKDRVVEETHVQLFLCISK
ncbi:hypothetical protein B0T19DRAFT_446628 [Cercophora scortea]|uniref:Uncharacterized protein n=1 Tax=Cercophora scortea TaxID=314031 RepID=A0AAE0M3G4_9PEZI|nr:hypothetical protein B0T19DRAFT_446628 [Cercophora scortea]